MDLLVEKLDGSRYYLSQYKVLITDFEESAPSVTRNSMKLDQRNGNIDFGGWHTDKTINITGYYRADDIDEEETLREKLYAMLSDPNGYYITQLKTTPNVTMERPGETSGGYYDKLSNYPSHKRFLVYTEAPEMELVGNVNGTLLYKLTAEFKTMKLPYGETPPNDITIDSPYKGVPVNFAIASHATTSNTTRVDASDIRINLSEDLSGKTITTSVKVIVTNYQGKIDSSSGDPVIDIKDGWSTGNWGSLINRINVTGNGMYTSVPKTFTKKALTGASNDIGVRMYNLNATIEVWVKVEKGSTATAWSPNPADPEYNSLAGNVSIPYSGSVPCNQLEQGFAIEFTAKESAISMSFKIDDTKLTYSGAVASGDVFLFTGFSYTQKGLSIVSETNKAYFTLQPDKPNRITCNVPGTVRILGLQNLYA